VEAALNSILKFFANGCCADTSVIFNNNYRLPSSCTSPVEFVAVPRQPVSAPLQNLTANSWNTRTTSLVSGSHADEVTRYDFKLNYRFASCL
jgi:hypothetical protein